MAKRSSVACYVRCLFSLLQKAETTQTWPFLYVVFIDLCLCASPYSFTARQFGARSSKKSTSHYKGMSVRYILPKRRRRRKKSQKQRHPRRKASLRLCSEHPLASLHLTTQCLLFFAEYIFSRILLKAESAGKLCINEME